MLCFMVQALQDPPLCSSTLMRRLFPERSQRMALDFYFLRDFQGITIKYLLSSVVVSDDEELQGADVADGLVVGAGLPLGGGELQLLHRNLRRLGRPPPQISHRFRVLTN